MEIIKTYPGQKDFELIDKLKSKIYSKELLVKAQLETYNDKLLKAVYILTDNNEPLATVALYKNPELNYNGHDCGTLGNYEAVDNIEASRQLLDYAIMQAKVAGITFLIGPMNGSTWDDFRFSNSDNSSSFMLEPHNPAYYEKQFVEVGFSPISEYISNIDEVMNYDNDFIRQREKQIEEMGVVIRPINMDEYENDLKRMFQFAVQAFKQSFLYTPITWEGFREKFFNLKNVCEPQHVMLAVHKDQVIGFVVNVKDQIKENWKSLVIKYLAASSNLKFRGLGQILVKKTAEIAKEEDYQAVIHALMNKKNAVTNLSQKNSNKLFKEYKLYGMPIYRLGLNA